VAVKAAGLRASESGDNGFMEGGVTMTDQGMDKKDMNKKSPMSQAELARLGGTELAYIREIAAETAADLLGDTVEIPSAQQLYCLYLADGTPIAISGSREAAEANAVEHDLMPMSVH
jgi:hypothetical protein